MEEFLKFGLLFIGMVKYVPDDYMKMAAYIYGISLLAFCFFGFYWPFHKESDHLIKKILIRFVIFIFLYGYMIPGFSLVSMIFFLPILPWTYENMDVNKFSQSVESTAKTVEFGRLLDEASHLEYNPFAGESIQTKYMLEHPEDYDSIDFRYQRLKLEHERECREANSEE